MCPVSAPESKPMDQRWATPKFEAVPYSYPKPGRIQVPLNRSVLRG